jgi:hypothetical protein
LNKIIATSNNKAKATWEVIRNTIGNGHACTDVTCLTITGKNIQNYQDIVNSFNNFFLHVANITQEGTNEDMEIDKRPMDYPYTSFLQPFPKLILKKTNCNKIEEIIRLMKSKAECTLARCDRRYGKRHDTQCDTNATCIVWSWKLY